MTIAPLSLGVHATNLLGSPPLVLTRWTQIGGILIYTVIAMALQHTGKRTDKKGWLLTFIITDVLFLSADLAILCILSRSGLPQHCHGLC